MMFGWKPWNGGANPLSNNGDVYVDIKLRNGREFTGKSKDVIWTHNNTPDDVIAYQINMDD